MPRYKIKDRSADEAATYSPLIIIDTDMGDKKVCSYYLDDAPNIEFNNVQWDRTNNMVDVLNTLNATASSQDIINLIRAANWSRD